MTDTIRSATPGTAGVLLLTGEIHIGKTTVCQSVIAQARRCGWSVAGLLSPTLFDSNGQRAAVEMIDLWTAERRTLAILNRETEGPRLGPYHFDPQTLRWGHSVIDEAIARGCDLLVVDEIGRLELEQDAGLGIVPLLAGGPLPLSLLVVRSSLLWLFAQKLPQLLTTRFEITRDNRVQAPARVARMLGLH